MALDDIIAVAGANPAHTVFYGGCEEDVVYYAGLGRRVHILNRFDGSTPRISATEVRDALVHDRPLENLLNPVLIEPVAKVFASRWEKFKLM